MSLVEKYQQQQQQQRVNGKADPIGDISATMITKGKNGKADPGRGLSATTTKTTIGKIDIRQADPGRHICNNNNNNKRGNGKADPGRDLSLFGALLDIFKFA